MPFRDPFDSYYPAIYKPALEPLGYHVTRSDDIFKPGVIMRDITRSIHQADLVLCEMSGRNPNVFYELGLAHANGKPVILVSRKENDIPFDLRHLRIIIYDSTRAGWEDTLRASIKQAAEAGEGPEGVDDIVRELVSPTVESVASLSHKLDMLLTSHSDAIAGA